MSEYYRGLYYYRTHPLATRESMYRHASGQLHNTPPQNPTILCPQTVRHEGSKTPLLTHQGGLSWNVPDNAPPAGWVL